MMTQQNNNLAQNINDDEFSSITQVELQVVEEINAPEQTASIISSFVTSCGLAAISHWGNGWMMNFVNIHRSGKTKKSY